MWLMKLIPCLCLIASALCSVSQERPNPYRRQGMCISSLAGDMMVGEQRQVPGQCVQAICQQDGGVSYNGCGYMVVEHRCKNIPVDNYPYPQCCQALLQCQQG